LTVHLALLITSDGIALAHRQRAGHWTILGDAAFAAPDLDAAMTGLRAQADAREGEGAAAILVLPDDQILYTSLTAPTSDPEITAFRIEEGLEGLTPYSVSELVYDWRAVESDRVKLAVVARETLDEARAFAASHGFTAAGFGAMPPQERFPGVPLFDLSPEAHGLSFPEEGIAFGPDTWPDAPEPEPEPEAEPATDGGTGPEADAQDGAANQPDAEQDAVETRAEEPAAEAPDTDGDVSEDAAEEHETAGAEDAAAAEPKAEADPDATDPVPDEEDAAEPRPDDPAAEAEADEADRDPEEVLAAAAQRGATPPAFQSAWPEDGATAHAPLEDPALTGPVAPIEADDDLPPAPSAAVLAARKASEAFGRGDETPAFSARGEPFPAREDDAAPEAPRKSRIGGLSAGSIAEDEDDAAARGARNPLAERLSRVRDVSRERPRDPTAPDPDAALRPAPRREDGRAAKPVVPPRGRLGAAPTEPPRKGRLTGFVAPPTETGPAPEPGGARRTLGDRLSGFISRGREEAASEGSAEGPGRLTALGHALRTDDAPEGQDARASTAAQTEAADSNLATGLLGRNPDQGTGRSFRTGLLLTVILLILLAAIAVWSALFLPDSPVARLFGSAQVASEDPLDAPAPPAAITAPPAIGEIADVGVPPGRLLDEEPAVIAAAPVEAPVEPPLDSPGEPAPEPADEPLMEDEAAADGVEFVFPADDTATALAPGPPDAGAAEAPTVAAPATVPPLPPLPQAGLPSLEQATADYEQFGIWQLPPERPDVEPLDTLSDLTMASVDSTVGALDAVSLTPPRVDPAESFGRVPPPPPFGERPQTNAAGLVVATPEGVVTPDGVRVTAGSPPVLPIPRPAEAVVPEPAPVFSIEDAILGTFRPTPRPDDLGAVEPPALPNAAPETARASLAPQPRAPGAAQGAAGASLFVRAAGQADAEAAALAAPEIADATRFAVASSLVPPTRPGNMDALVASAVRSEPEPPAAAVEAAAIAPGPSIPTSADVARAATQRNELRLRDINLIGVTGTPSDRRALVRLPSGRFVRVGVGDRLDGGRVAAIGETTLQYVRNGRTVTLDIPG
jgi:hypothetical protein